MSGPLTGVTVVEFGQFVVVPFCTQLMADCGARVIKVEPLTGDSYRTSFAHFGNGFSRHFLAKNRGKESIALDLGHPDARPVIDALIKMADVVLTNMSPAAIQRNRLDYESVRQINPSVIHGAVSAFGHVGPEAPLPGMDVVAQARSGLLAALGAERDGVPLPGEVQVADYSTALLLFGAINAALYSRQLTGEGQKVEVALIGGALAIQNNSLIHVHEQDSWREKFVTEDLPAMRTAGADGEQIEAARSDARPDPRAVGHHYRAFRTADGFVTLGAASPPTRRRMSEVLGIDNSLADTDPPEYGRQIAAEMAKQPTAHWVEQMRAVDVPVTEVKHIDELLFDEHAIAEGLVADYDHPVVGRFRAFGQPIRMSGTPLELGPPPPSLAEHTRSILAELGFTDEQVDALASAEVVRAD